VVLPGCCFALAGWQLIGFIEWHSSEACYNWHLLLERAGGENSRFSTAQSGLLPWNKKFGMIAVVLLADTARRTVKTKAG
jgi:hypothetical protein